MRWLYNTIVDETETRVIRDESTNNSKWNKLVKRREYSLLLLDKKTEEKNWKLWERGEEDVISAV